MKGVGWEQEDGFTRAFDVIDLTRCGVCGTWSLKTKPCLIRDARDNICEVCEDGLSWFPSKKVES